MDQPIRPLTDEEVEQLKQERPDLFDYDAELHDMMFDAPGG